MINLLKASYALHKEPLYIRVDDSNMSIGSVLEEAVGHLLKAGKSHEAHQLARVQRDHELFAVDGNQVGKRFRFKDLSKNVEINGRDVNLAEVELIKQHIGG